MTDLEQKAEEYAKNFCYTNNNESAEDKCTRAYKDGYKQGQKEQNCVHCSNRSSELRKSKLELEKENAELKDKVQMWDFFQEGCGFKKRGLKTAIQISEYIDKLESQISELQGYKRVIDNLKAEGFDSVMSIKDYITKTKEEIAELKEVHESDKKSFRLIIENHKKEIEKMKCCGNCKHNKDYDFCFGSDCNELDKWELEK